MQIHWVAFEVHVAAEVEVDPLGEANCVVRVELDGLGLVDESRLADLDRLVQEQVRLPHPAERGGGEKRGQEARKEQEGAMEQEGGLEE